MIRQVLSTPSGKIAVGALGALGVRRLLRSPQARFAAMSGTTIAGPSAAGWITDFLNASYFRRDPRTRDVADLRLAFGIVTTRWHRLDHRRLVAADVAGFHRAFGRLRLADTIGAPRGTLDAAGLAEGATRLFGEWFTEAWADPQRRAWGMAFSDSDARRAYLPERRLEHSQLGGITPPAAPAADRTWHTYPPVRLGDEAAAEVALGILSRPERWPDLGCELGRFTPVRSGGLDGQTFEIEVLGEPVGPVPVVLRGYVTATEVRTHPAELADATAQLNDAFAVYAPHDPPPLPDGATPLALIELTTHIGHFLGRAINRLLVWTHDGEAWVRAVGTWDPMEWPLDRIYDRMGRYSQHAFWGMGRPAESMLHQLAAAVDAAGADDREDA